VNAPPALATRPSSLVVPLPADADLGLAALLDLFTHEEPAAVATSTRRSLRSGTARLRAWAQEWSRRATAWGAGPGVPGVPGDRSLVRLPSGRPAPLEVQ
jgi:hypothetical protein